MTKKRDVKTGRPNLLTPEMHSNIVKCVGMGLANEHIAGYVGISEACLYNWKAQGREDIENKKKTIYSELVKDIKRSRSAMILKRLAKIHNAEDEHWQASAWLLERLEYKTYGRKDTHEITNKQGEAFLLGHGKIENIKPKKISNEQLDLLVDQIQKKLLEDKGEK